MRRGVLSVADTARARQFTLAFLIGYTSTPWGRSSAGRAPRSQCGGREFDPPRLHQIPCNPLRNQRVFCCRSSTVMGHTTLVSHFRRVATCVSLRDYTAIDTANLGIGSAFRKVYAM